MKNLKFIKSNCILNSFKSLIILFVFVSMISCEDDDSEDTAIGDAICGISQLNNSVNTGTLTAIDGELPWFGTFIDNQNFSSVTGGTLIIREDGTWNTSLDNEVMVNGNQSFNLIERSGTFECVDNVLFMVNDQNQSAGELIEQDGNLILISELANSTFAF